MSAALRREFQEIYFDIDNVPEEKKNFEIDSDTGKEHLIGLQNGCLLGYDFTSKGIMWFRASYWDWEGNLAGSYRDALFVWILGRWWHLWTYSDTIS